MSAPSYHLTNYPGGSDPAGDILALIEAELTTAGWSFVEQVHYNQGNGLVASSYTAKLMRVWKNPASLNAAGVDFYIGFTKDTVPGINLTARAFEDWNSTTKTMVRPVLKAPPAAGYSAGLARWTSICHNGLTGASSKFVAVAEASNQVMTSPDGITWTYGTMPSVQNWSSVTYGNGVYVAVAGKLADASYGSSAIPTTVAATSTDGLNWTQRTLPVSASWSGVAYGNSLFMAVSGSVTATSPDGITWTQRTNTTAHLIAFGLGKFVVLARDSYGATPQCSTDGTSWASAGSLGGWTGWRFLTFTGGKFYVGGQFGGAGSSAVAYSSDVPSSTAVWNFTATMPTTPYQLQNGIYRAVATIGSRTVFAYQADTQPLPFETAPYSNDGGATMQPVPALLPLQDWNCMASGNGVAVALSLGGGLAATTTDGLTWTPRRLSSAVSQNALGNYPLDAWNPPQNRAFIADAYSGIVLNTAYDVGVLASKSYVAISVAANGSGNNKFTWILGLYNPQHTDSQVTYPPLMVLALNDSFGNNSGVSRSMRVTPDATMFTLFCGPEHPLLGSYSYGGKPDVTFNKIRCSRAMLFAGLTRYVSVSVNGINRPGYVLDNPALFGTSGGIRGWLYDAVVVPVAAQDSVKVGDTFTVGSKVYTALSQPNYPLLLTSLTSSDAFFFDTTAGS